MSSAALVIVLGGAFAGLALVLNHCYARLALVELTLNEGLPPGHQPTEAIAGLTTTESVEPASALAGGLHVFLSRSCHACQRLIDEFESVDIELDAPLHLRYIDRPRPIAVSVAARHRAELHDHEAELVAQIGADPLPYTVGIGTAGLVSRAVTPTLAQVLHTARDAGISIAMVQHEL